jgi:hypothetical protein
MLIKRRNVQQSDIRRGMKENLFFFSALAFKPAARRALGLEVFNMIITWLSFQTCGLWRHSGGMVPQQHRQLLSDRLLNRKPVGGDVAYWVLARK